MSVIQIDIKQVTPSFLITVTGGPSPGNYTGSTNTYLMIELETLFPTLREAPDLSGTSFTSLSPGNQLVTSFGNTFVPTPGQCVKIINTSGQNVPNLMLWRAHLGGNTPNVFTPFPPNGVTYFVTNGDGNQEDLWPSQTVFQDDPCCVAEGTLVECPKEIRKPINELRGGDLVVDHKGQSLPVRQLVRFDIPTCNFIQMEKGSVGPNRPSSNLKIRPGHPILVDGREIVPEDLLCMPSVNEIQLDKPVYVYTLITDRRTFVNMQGAMVGTWSESSWENYVENAAPEMSWKFVQ